MITAVLMREFIKGFGDTRTDALSSFVVDVHRAHEGREDRVPIRCISEASPRQKLLS